MATNIVLKRSSSSGAVPGTSDLALGEIALNTYDGKMYMKKTVSGSSSIVELTGSSAPTSSAFAHDSYKYTASSNQTTFTGSDADSKTLSYTAGQIQVFLNGVLLDAADYTATNGSSVVLGSGASANDILYIISFTGTNPFDYFKYTATNAQTSFSGNDANSESLIYTVGNIVVYLNGVLLDATDYTATSGTTVVLASGASSGDILVIFEYNETGLTDVASDTTPQLGGDLDVNGSDIVSTSNAHIDIIPHGTGNVNLGTDTVLIGTSGENVTVTTSGTGDMTLSTNSGTNSGSIVIADGANNDITLTPNGTGVVNISKVDINGGAIDGTTIGSSSASSGAFTTLTSSGNLDVTGGKITSSTTSSDAYVNTAFQSESLLKLSSNNAEDNYSGIQFTNSSGSYEMFIGSVQVGPSAADIVFQGYDRGASAYKEYIRINDDANTTFAGTVTAGNLLSYGDGTNNNTFIQGRSSAGYYSGIKLARGAGNWSNASNNHFGMVVTDNGLELAKFTAPGDNATGKAVYMTMADGGNTTFAGTVTAQSYSSSSDVRLKQNILSINHGLDFIMKLNPVSYMKMKVSDYFNYSSSVSKEMLFEFGLLAQDVKEISEELDFDNKIVSVKENGIHYMNYQQIMMPLIKATQEQQDIIESQQKMIEELKENLKRLETLILENK